MNSLPVGAAVELATLESADEKSTVETRAAKSAVESCDDKTAVKVDTITDEAVATVEVSVDEIK